MISTYSLPNPLTLLIFCNGVLAGIKILQKVFSLEQESLDNLDDVRVITWAQEPLEAGTAEVYQASSHSIPPPPESIPTVSEWGMLLMVLLIASAGTVIFRSRRQIALCNQPVEHRPS